MTLLNILIRNTNRNEGVSTELSVHSLYYKTHLLYSSFINFLVFNFNLFRQIQLTIFFLLSEEYLANNLISISKVSYLEILSLVKSKLKAINKIGR